MKEEMKEMKTPAMQGTSVVQLAQGTRELESRNEDKKV